MTKGAVMEGGVHGQYDGAQARIRRHEALAAALERFPIVQGKLEAAYGMRLPRHLAYAAAFFLGMSAEERRLCPVSLFGLAQWFEWLAPGEAPRIATLDERLEGRFRRDVPELVTIASGNGDGSHWGFFYDLPSELPRIVAHGFARDDGAVSQVGTTLLGAIRRELTMEGLDPDDRRRMRALVAWLDALHVEEQRAHREEGIGAPYEGRIGSFGAGLGAYLPGFRLPEGIPDDRLSALAERTAEAERWIELARADLRAGKGELALVLGRELHYLDTEATGEVARELLAPAYEALGRPQLAAIARVHHEHRDLATVAIYRTAAQIAQIEAQPEYVEPPLVGAVREGDRARAARLLAERPPINAITAAIYALLPFGDAPPPEARAMLDLLLSHGGGEAASAMLPYALQRILACADPDLLEKAGAPRAEKARELVEQRLAKKDRTVVDMLLARAARPLSATDCERAVRAGDLELFEQIVRSAPPGFDPKTHRGSYMLEDPERPSGGATLLHFAVCTANVDLVRALLDRGLDPAAKDDAGKTARDLARALWMIRPRDGSAMMDLLGRPAAPEAPAVAKAEWEIGGTAMHPKFGQGTITHVSGSGADAKVTVKFSSGEKTLLAKFVTRAGES
jgi:hypothetical protein